MAKLIVYAYGNNNHSSAEMLLQFLQYHQFQYQDRLLVVSGFNGEDLRSNWQPIVDHIKLEISSHAQTQGMKILFDGYDANAELIFVNFHNLERIYAMVYARIHQLLMYGDELDTRIGSMGDGHPQIIVAMTDACLQFPGMTVWFAFGNQSRTMTRLIHDVTADAIPTDLSRLIVYNYKIAPNIYHDMHQFIEQLNVLLRNHEYDAVRTSIYSKYGRVELNQQIATIRYQWFALTDGMRYWHNFMHANAIQHFNNLHVRCNSIASPDVVKSLSRVRGHLEVLKYQYDMLEELAQLKMNANPQIPEVIVRFKEWLTINKKHGYELAIDKYMNAVRCIDQRRFDDASVRLNSVLELVATVRLLLEYDVITSNMRERELCNLLGRNEPVSNGITSVSRRDLYRIIQRKNQQDALWRKYQLLGGNALADADSRLELAVRKRHKSYLVHGNSVLSEADCYEFADFIRQLLDAAVGFEINWEAYAMPQVELAVNFDAKGQIVPMGWTFVE
jgi:hypothetical protein